MGKGKKDEKKKNKSGKNGGAGHEGNGNELIKRLNHALSLEYAATIQYLQQQCLVTGQERQQFAPFFAASSSEAHLHAQNLGNKIVALGGAPTIEPAEIREGKNLAQMLRYDLEMEREALDAYVKAWESAQGNPPLLFWLEEIISTEQLHVDELEKLNSAYS
ncbi:MAG TPA: ferritin-like domain-containing protein [Blastocatellia bacterium]|nr:ferritin-like domain-containing protein [Blastocatellia bacterium]